MIFKDYGADAQSRLTLRAKSIEIKDGGEMWIGSRTCRYQGLADVVLYGNRADMDNHDMVGRKYLWTGSGGTLEMHGKDKKSWTKLNEHLFKDSVAVEKLSWYQTRWQDTYMGNRLVVHVLRFGFNLMSRKLRVGIIFGHQAVYHSVNLQIESMLKSRR